MLTITQAINRGAARLQASNIEHERRTATVLLGQVLAVDRTHLLINSEQQIGETDYELFLGLVERRAAGEPLQYITGHQEFYGLDFVVTPAVLIPRPETEFLVERVVSLARDLESPLIVDVGTGSGCIAIAAAASLRKARVIATDISAAALEVARINAERHAVSDRVEFVQGDLLEPLARRKLENSVDVLASNPPYVNEGRPDLIQREVRDWEPGEALFGGPDGLEFYRRLLADGLEFVRPGGFLVFEIGYSQLDSIKSLIEEYRWELIDVTRDLQDIPRTITLTRA